MIQPKPAPPGAVDVARRGLLAAALAATLPRAARADEPGYEWRPWRGRPVPALDLPGLDGSRFRLDEQHGKVVLANFWATWCEPCRAEMPSLQRLAARHADDGLAVVAINYRESSASIRRFVDAMRLDLPVLLDRDGEAAIAWTPRVFPSTAIIDRAGRPAGVLVGEIDWAGEAARELLAPLLAAGPAPRMQRTSLRTSLHHADSRSAHGRLNLSSREAP